MEHRKYAKIAIGLAFLLIVTCCTWYIGIPKVSEERKTIKTPIPTMEARAVVKNFNPNFKYFLKEDIIISKEKTWIPFKYNIDTLYRTNKSLMYKYDGE